MLKGTARYLGASEVTAQDVVAIELQDNLKHLETEKSYLEHPNRI